MAVSISINQSQKESINHNNGQQVKSKENGGAYVGVNPKKNLVGAQQQNNGSAKNKMEVAHSQEFVPSIENDLESGMEKETLSMLDPPKSKLTGAANQSQDTGTVAIERSQSPVAVVDYQKASDTNKKDS